MAQEDHWLLGFNFNVEEWFEGDHYETLAICRSLKFDRAAFISASRPASGGAARFSRHKPGRRCET
jgi:hypothetical protein